MASKRPTESSTESTNKLMRMMPPALDSPPAMIQSATTEEAQAASMESFSAAPKSDGPANAGALKDPGFMFTVNVATNAAEATDLPATSGVGEQEVAATTAPDELAVNEETTMGHVQSRIDDLQTRMNECINSFVRDVSQVAHDYARSKLPCLNQLQTQLLPSAQRIDELHGWNDNFRSVLQNHQHPMQAGLDLLSKFHGQNPAGSQEPSSNDASEAERQSQTVEAAQRDQQARPRLPHEDCVAQPMDIPDELPTEAPADVLEDRGEEAAPDGGPFANPSPPSSQADVQPQERPPVTCLDFNSDGAASMDSFMDRDATAIEPSTPSAAAASVGSRGSAHSGLGGNEASVHHLCKQQSAFQAPARQRTTFPPLNGGNAPVRSTRGRSA